MSSTDDILDPMYGKTSYQEFLERMAIGKCKYFSNPPIHGVFIPSQREAVPRMSAEMLQVLSDRQAMKLDPEESALRTNDKVFKDHHVKFQRIENGPMVKRIEEFNAREEWENRPIVKNLSQNDYSAGDYRTLNYECTAAVTVTSVYRVRQQYHVGAARGVQCY